MRAHAYLVAGGWSSPFAPPPPAAAAPPPAPPPAGSAASTVTTIATTRTQFSSSSSAATAGAGEGAPGSAPLKAAWSEAVEWLARLDFISTDGESGLELTPRGKACAAFADGHPLIMGTIISDGHLQDLSTAEVCAWVCLFLQMSLLKHAVYPV